MKNIKLLCNILCVITAAIVLAFPLVACDGGDDNDTWFRGKRVSEQEWTVMTNAFLTGWNATSVTARIEEQYARSKLSGIWEIDLNNGYERIRLKETGWRFSTSIGVGGIIEPEEYTEIEDQYRVKDDNDNWFSYCSGGRYDGRVRAISDDYDTLNVVERIDQDALEIFAEVINEKTFADFEFDKSDGSYSVAIDGDFTYKLYFNKNVLFRVGLFGNNDIYQTCTFYDINNTKIAEIPNEVYSAIDEYKRTQEH